MNSVHQFGEDREEDGSVKQRSSFDVAKEYVKAKIVQRVSLTLSFWYSEAGTDPAGESDYTRSQDYSSCSPRFRFHKDEKYHDYQGEGDCKRERGSV